MDRGENVWCGVAQFLVRRGSVYGAAWLSLWCGMAQLWCGVAQFMVRRGSVGSALACCKAGPSTILSSVPQGGVLTEQTSDEEMERGLSEWRLINALYEYD
jgi:hypothetical protein